MPTLSSLSPISSLVSSPNLSSIFSSDNLPPPPAPSTSCSPPQKKARLLISSLYPSKQTLAQPDCLGSRGEVSATRRYVYFYLINRVFDSCNVMNYDYREVTEWYATKMNAEKIGSSSSPQPANHYNRTGFAERKESRQLRKLGEDRSNSEDSNPPSRSNSSFIQVICLPSDT